MATGARLRCGSPSRASPTLRASVSRGIWWCRNEVTIGKDPAAPRGPSLRLDGGEGRGSCATAGPGRPLAAHAASWRTPPTAPRPTTRRSTRGSRATTLRHALPARRAARARTRSPAGSLPARGVLGVPLVATLSLGSPARAVGRLTGKELRDEEVLDLDGAGARVGGGRRGLRGRCLRPRRSGWRRRPCRRLGSDGRRSPGPRRLSRPTSGQGRLRAGRGRRGCEVGRGSARTDRSLRQSLVRSGRRLLRVHARRRRGSRRLRVRAAVDVPRRGQRPAASGACLHEHRGLRAHRLLHPAPHDRR